MLGDWWRVRSARHEAAPEREPSKLLNPVSLGIDLSAKGMRIDPSCTLRAIARLLPARRAGLGSGLELGDSRFPRRNIWVECAGEGGLCEAGRAYDWPRAAVSIVSRRATIPNNLSSFGINSPYHYKARRWPRRRLRRSRRRFVIGANQFNREQQVIKKALRPQSLSLQHEFGVRSQGGLNHRH